MNRDEGIRRLSEGGELAYVWSDKPLPQGASFKRSLSLRQLSIDPPHLYPPRVLQEEPTYVFEQKMARSKPFRVELFEHAQGFEGDLELGFTVVYYLSDIEEVDQFLSQFDITICDFKDTIMP